MVQLAMSPFSLTSMAPRMAMSMCPPRIIANESALEKKEVLHLGDRLFAGVDQVGIDLCLGRIGTIPASRSPTAARLPRLRDVVRYMVGMPMPRLT